MEAALGRLLIDEGGIPQRRLDEAVRLSMQQGGRLDTYLLELGLIDEAQLTDIMARAYGLHSADFRALVKVDLQALKVIPSRVADRCQIFPFLLEDNDLHVLCPAPPDTALLEEIGEMVGKNLVLHVATEYRICRALAHFYGLPLKKRFMELQQVLDGPKSGEAPAAIPEAEDGQDAKADQPSKQKWDLAAALAKLSAASDRDAVIKVSLRFSGNFLDCTAFFGIHGGQVIGWGASIGGDVAEDFRGVTFPLDEPSAFRTVIETSAPYLGVIEEGVVHDTLFRALERNRPRTAVLFPILVTGRVVGILYGDNSQRPVRTREISDLIAFCGRIGAAFENIILARKRPPSHGGVEASQAPSQAPASQVPSQVPASSVPSPVQIAASPAATESPPPLSQPSADPVELPDELSAVFPEVIAEVLPEADLPATESATDEAAIQIDDSEQPEGDVLPSDVGGQERGPSRPSSGQVSLSEEELAAIWSEGGHPSNAGPSLATVAIPPVDDLEPPPSKVDAELTADGQAPQEAVETEQPVEPGATAESSVVDSLEQLDDWEDVVYETLGAKGAAAPQDDTKRSEDFPAATASGIEPVAASWHVEAPGDASVDEALHGQSATEAVVFDVDASDGAPVVFAEEEAVPFVEEDEQAVVFEEDEVGLTVGLPPFAAGREEAVVFEGEPLDELADTVVFEEDVDFAPPAVAGVPLPVREADTEVDLEAVVFEDDVVEEASGAAAEESVVFEEIEESGSAASWTNALEATIGSGRQGGEVAEERAAFVGPAEDVAFEDIISEAIAAPADDTGSDVPLMLGTPRDDEDVTSELTEEDLRQLCDTVAGGDSDEAKAAAQKLMEADERILPLLISRFPGRVQFDPFGQDWGMPAPASLSSLMSLLIARPEIGAEVAFSHLDSHFPALRWFAVYLFAYIHEPRAIKVVMPRLHDEEPRIRHLSAKVLAGYSADAGFKSVVKHLKSRLKSPVAEVRRRAIYFLGFFKVIEAVQDLIECLGAREVELVAETTNALAAITLQVFGTNQRKWTKWWEKNRERSRIEWLIDGLRHKDRNIRYAASVELTDLTKETFGYDYDGKKRDRDKAVKQWDKWWLSERRRMRVGE